MSLTPDLSIASQCILLWLRGHFVSMFVLLDSLSARTLHFLGYGLWIAVYYGQCTSPILCGLSWYMTLSDLSQCYVRCGVVNHYSNMFAFERCLKDGM